MQVPEHSTQDPARRQKVAHVVLSLERGGLERLVCDLSETTQHAGMDSLVICLDQEGALAEGMRRRGIPVVVVKRNRGSDPSLIVRLARVLRERNVDVVHTHGPDPMFYGGWAARLAGTRVRIHTQHDTMLADGTWRDRLKFRLALNAFHNVVAVSDKTAEIIRAYERRRDRIVTIRNGIDVHRFGREGTAECRSPIASHPARLTVGTVARLAPEKGINRLIEAFARTRRRHPECRLVIVGDGPERSALERLAARLGLEHDVVFTGHSDQVSSALSTFDLFVLPSLTEGIPLALLEAMAAGLPVIATRVGGVPEVVNDACGLLVPPDRADELEHALNELIANPEKRAQMGAQARIVAAGSFDLGSMAAGYRELYRQDTARRWWTDRARALVQRVCPRRLVMWKGPATRSEVSLTLDDGPDPIYTPQLLDCLDAHGVKATFFLVGERVAAHSDLVQEIVDRGHELGSHSYTHPDFLRLSWRAALRELDSTRRALARWTGAAAPRLFRPPHGAVCSASTLAPWTRGERVVLWSVDLKDYLAAEVTDITARAARTSLRPGDIILYHGHSPASLRALPEVLGLVRERGLSFTPVSRMLRA